MNRQPQEKSQVHATAWSPLRAVSGRRGAERAVVHEAIGILMHRLDICSMEAAGLLSSSAAVAALHPEQLARALIEEFENGVPPA